MRSIPALINAFIINNNNSFITPYQKSPIANQWTTQINKYK